MSAPHHVVVPSDTSAPRRASQRERIGLFAGRGLDKRLTPLGVWLAAGHP